MTDDATDTLSERFDEITGALQDLSDVLDEYEDLATVLEHVVEGAVRIVPGADMAGVTLVSDESAKTVAATHPRVREVDQVQYANDGGPCLTASRDGRSVVVDVDQVRSRWPALEASAADLGIKSFIALPFALGSYSRLVQPLQQRSPRLPVPGRVTARAVHHRRSHRAAAGRTAPPRAGVDPKPPDRAHFSRRDRPSDRCGHGVARPARRRGVRRLVSTLRTRTSRSELSRGNFSTRSRRRGPVDDGGATPAAPPSSCRTDIVVR